MNNRPDDDSDLDIPDTSEEWFAKATLRMPAMGKPMVTTLYVPTRVAQAIALVSEAKQREFPLSLQWAMGYVISAAQVALRVREPGEENNPGWAVVRVTDLKQLEDHLLTAKAAFATIRQDEPPPWLYFLHWQTWMAGAVIAMLGFLLDGVI